MNRRNFPTGQASTAMLKGMYRALAAEKGLPAAEQWLRAIRMVRADLDDETRVVPLPTLHRALVAGAEIGSRDIIPRIWKYLVAPDNLGVWVRVLRGTTAPGEAFARLDSGDSEYGRTTRWETTDSARGWWRGLVRIAHDPALEADGLLKLARLAELAAVPALFGWRGAVATELPSKEAASAAGPVQEFAVEWSMPDAVRGSVVATVVGGAAASLPLLMHLTSPLVGGLVAFTGAAAGGVTGVIRAREHSARAVTRAQALRVQALERSLLLKELREREMGGQLEGTVAAGQYRILRRMGSGATGVIYEAVRISDGLPVAIKLLRAAAAHEAVASDRLRREAEALGLSWHPNVVEVIDHGHLADGTAYLVMELLHGESLATRLRSKGRLTPRDLLPVAMQVCDALAAVHAAGVVHRDLKPSNIFLAVDRDDPAGSERVKLLDFGIARVEWEETRITNTGGPLGTPGYMSPEQESGSGEIDARSDVFALGAVLFECLVGEPPPPRSPSGLVRTGDSTAVRFDSGTQKSATLVPPLWRTIIEKAMALQPADRYQDARSFAQALRGVREEIAKAEGST
jgi:serine/threonine-protein kinase